MRKINPKISVIIASLGESSHLWFTVSSFKEQALDLGDSIEIIIGDNSPNKPNICRDKLPGVKWVNVERPSTSLVRNIPAKEAKGEYFCFADTHLMLCNGLLKRAVAVLDADPNIGILHTRAVFWGGGDGYYSYKLTLEENFNGVNYNICQNPKMEPYMVPASGHGLFFIRKELFEKMGGYLDTQDGWGGEEIFLDLLVWMFDYHVMVDPLCKHWHLPGEFNRPYCRNGVKFILNQLQAAYVLGGELWLKKVADHYKLMDFETVAKYLPDIPIIMNERRLHVLKNAKYTLDQVLTMFDDWGMKWRDGSCPK